MEGWVLQSVVYHSSQTIKFIPCVVMLHPTEIVNWGGSPPAMISYGHQVACLRHSNLCAWKEMAKPEFSFTTKMRSTYFLHNLKRKWDKAKCRTTVAIQNRDETQYVVSCHLSKLRKYKRKQNTDIWTGKGCSETNNRN